MSKFTGTVVMDETSFAYDLTVTPLSPSTFNLVGTVTEPGGDVIAVKHLQLKDAKAKDGMPDRADIEIHLIKAMERGDL